MTQHFFLSGHGGWVPSQGYAQVPKGCKVHFYTHFAKNLITGMEHKILSGSYNTIERTIEEFRVCPNMRLSPQPDDWTETAERKLATRNDPDCHLIVCDPGEPVTLDELFEEFSDQELGDGAEFHWLACQTLSLAQVGGRQHGLNAGDFRHELKPGRYRIKNSDGTFSWI